MMNTYVFDRMYMFSLLTVVASVAVLHTFYRLTAFP
jgi:hypothetical protein